MEIEKLSNKLNECIASYVELFKNKHGMVFEFWVADRTGTTANFGDYYIWFDDMRMDLDLNVPKDLFIEWYDLSLEQASHERPITNYYRFLKDKNVDN